MKNPKFEFEFQENGFKIINKKNKNDNNFYEYRFINEFLFEKKKISWITSIILFVVDILLEGGSAGIYKKEHKLKFNYKNKATVVELTNCPLDKSELISEKIKNNLNPE